MSLVLGTYTLKQSWLSPCCYKASCLYVNIKSITDITLLPLIDLQPTKGHTHLVLWGHFLERLTEGRRSSLKVGGAFWQVARHKEVRGESDVTWLPDRHFLLMSASTIAAVATTILPLCPTPNSSAFECNWSQATLQESPRSPVSQQHCRDIWELRSCKVLGFWQYGGSHCWTIQPAPWSHSSKAAFTTNIRFIRSIPLENSA